MMSKREKRACVKQVERITLLWWLKVKSLMRPVIFVSFILLAPLLLGLIAGYGNRMNYSEETRVIVVDLDQSEASRLLISHLRERGWDVLEAAQEDAERMLQMGDAGISITLGDRFDRFVAGQEDDADIHFQMAEQSLLQVTVRQSLMLYAESQRTLGMLERNTREFYRRNDLPTENVETELAALIAYYREAEGAMPIEYINRPEENLRRTVVVGDFTLEVLYLAVLAVIAATTEQREKKRLRAIAHATTTDSLLGYAVWLVFGFLQIVLYTGAMALTMADKRMFSMLFPLFTYFALILALASFLKHLAPEIGLYLGLFTTFMLALIGGVFFPLPGVFLTRFAQFTPMGWIYARQLSLARLPDYSIWLISGLLLAYAVWTFNRPERKVRKR